MGLKHRLYAWSTYCQKKLMPGLRYCQEIYEEVLEAEVRPGSDWLDLGCGWHVLPEWRLDAERRLVDRCGLVAGIDYDLPSLRKHRTIPHLVRGDLNWLPFRDQAFDLVTSDMVLEHVEHPDAVFREVARLLKPGGRFVFHTVSVYAYATLVGRVVPDALHGPLIRLVDDRDEADVFPAFYRVNRPREIPALAARTGFRLLRLRMLVSSPRLRIVPPLVPLELLFTRLLMTDRLKMWRPNFIAILEKQPLAEPAALAEVAHP